MKLTKKILIVVFLSLLVISLGPIAEAQIVDYSLAYDEAGNLKQGFDQYLEYNDFNQLVRVRQFNATGQILEEYVYDQDGERFVKYEPLINQTTYYISDNFIQVVNSTGSYLTTYYFDGETLIGLKDPDGRKFFYHPDHLGSTDLVTNETGNVVEETTYKPYGEVQSGGQSRFLFTGKELDDTGLYYYGARYYNAFFSHFTQPDQNVQDIYNPQDLNRYAYVRNNPYRYIDPTGDVPVDVVIDVGFIAYGLYSFSKDPSFKTAGELGLDVAFAALPYVPNLNRLKKGAEAAAQAAEGADKVRDVEKGVDASKLTSQEIGKIGEDELTRKFGGETQKTFDTPLGRRVVDQFSEGTIREAKTGYKSLDNRIKNQIEKDTNLIETGRSKSAEYHFFRSPKTGKMGPSKNLLDLLSKKRFKTKIHNRGATGKKKQK